MAPIAPSTSSLLLRALLAASSAAASSTTHFVSSSRGDDGNDGASPATAWRTLPRALTGLARGDSLLLRQGDVFDLAAAPLQLVSFGSGANDGGMTPPALLGAYADGQPADSTPRPWLRRGTGAAPAAGAVVQCVDCVGVAIVGLELSGAEQGVLFSFSAPASPAGPAWGAVAVEDCFIHDIRGTRPGSDPTAWGSGVGLNTTARSDVEAVNISVSRNVFNDSDTAYQNCITAQTHGGCVWPGAEAGGYVTTDGVLFARNLVNHVWYNSAFFAFTRNTRVLENVFLDDVPRVLFPLGTTDIIVGEVDATVSLVGNEIANRGEVPGGPDGCGIDLEDSSSGVVVADNYVSNTYGAALLLFAGTGSGSKNISVLNNTFLRDGCVQKSGDHGVIAFLHAGQTGTVGGNTFASCGGSSVVYFGYTSGFVFADNAVYNTSSLDGIVAATPIVVASAPGDGATVTVTATCSTPGAVMRYTLDGGRVTAAAPEWPAGGIEVQRATAVLVKAFAAGLVESAVAGGVFASAR